MPISSTHHFAFSTPIYRLTLFSELKTVYILQNVLIGLINYHEMPYYPYVPKELTRRKWGLARAKQNLEMSSKSLVINRGEGFKLIAQVFEESRDHLRLKVTSDGSRTICTSNESHPMVTIIENHPTIADETKESKSVKYSLNQDAYIRDFVFSNNEREILYHNENGLYCLDLETGNIREGPVGNYGRGTIQVL